MSIHSAWGALERVGERGQRMDVRPPGAQRSGAVQSFFTGSRRPAYGGPRALAAKGRRRSLSPPPLRRPPPAQRAAVPRRTTRPGGNPPRPSTMTRPTPTKHDRANQLPTAFNAAGPRRRNLGPVAMLRGRRPGRGEARSVTFEEAWPRPAGVTGNTHGGYSVGAPAAVADFRRFRSEPSPTRQRGAGVTTAPTFGHANYPGTIGIGVLIRASATGPPGMLSRLRGGPVFVCRVWSYERRRCTGTSCSAQGFAHLVDAGTVLWRVAEHRVDQLSQLPWRLDRPSPTVCHGLSLH